eukprot:g15924.t1
MMITSTFTTRYASKVSCPDQRKRCHSIVDECYPNHGANTLLGAGTASDRSMMIWEIPQPQGRPDTNQAKHRAARQAQDQAGQ